MFIQMCVHSLRSPNLKIFQNLQKMKRLLRRLTCARQTMNFWQNELVNIVNIKQGRLTELLSRTAVIEI